VTAVAIVGVELAIPEERITQPFLLRVAEHRLDLRAHVELAHVLVERGQEGDGRDLLDQAAIARLGRPAAARLLVARRLRRIDRRLRAAIRQLRPHREGLRHHAQDGLGILDTLDRRLRKLPSRGRDDARFQRGAHAVTPSMGE
jgi:hypothetical protein